MAHVAFVRSPYAHAHIKTIDAGAAKKARGVIAVVTGAELAKVITPWVGVLTHLKGIKSAPQHAIAVDRACWRAKPSAPWSAKTRAEAEDACELVDVDYEELTPVTDPETALDAGDAGHSRQPRRQPDLGTQARRRRSGRRFQKRGCDRRDDVRVRPPHRRHQ